MFVCDYCYYSLQVLSTSMPVLLAAATYALLESSFLAGCGDEASGRALVLCCALAFSSKFLINCACSQWLNLTILSHGLLLWTFCWCSFHFISKSEDVKILNPPTTIPLVAISYFEAWKNLPEKHFDINAGSEILGFLLD